MNWDLVYIGATCWNLAWQWCYCFRFMLRWWGKSSPTINWIFFEFRPLIPLALVLAYVAGGVTASDGAGWRLFNIIIGFFNWFMARREKDDDDRWKKRAKKAASVVAQVGGRLQVVPVGGKS